MNILDQPVHADGLGTTQLLLPGLIELGNDFLCFLLGEHREMSLKFVYAPFWNN